MFEDSIDRMCILPAFKKGETFAVLTPDKKQAVSAVTFFQEYNSVVVLFLSTLTGFQSMGFVTFLLSLLQEVVCGREKKKKTPIEMNSESCPNLSKSV